MVQNVPKPAQRNLANKSSFRGAYGLAFLHQDIYIMYLLKLRQKVYIKSYYQQLLKELSEIFKKQKNKKVNEP